MSDKQRMIEFLKANYACKEGFEFAVRECNSLMDCWNKARPDWLIWLATRKGVLTDRELHEFMLASAESVKHLMKDQRSLDALTVKRRWLDGEVTDEELEESKELAFAAFAAAANSAAANSAAAAANSAAAAAANSAAAADADYASYAASYAAAFAVDAASNAAAANAAFASYAANAAASAYDAERIKQADWLRKNTKPNL